MNGVTEEFFLFNLEDMLAYNKESGNKNENQTSLFGGLPQTETPAFKLKDVPPATMAEKLLWEKNYWDFIFQAIRLTVSAKN